jgi:hypothetical protein
MREIILLFSILLSFTQSIFAQIKWMNVDSLYQPLPSSVHIYFTNSPIDTASFRAYYLIADLKDKKLNFTADTTLNRRLTPAKFYEKGEKPLVVVNCSFFSFETNRNLNVVVRSRKVVGYNVPVIGKGKDTFTYRHPFGSAIGISKKRKADVAWTFTDSSIGFVYAAQLSLPVKKDSVKSLSPSAVKSMKYALPDVSLSRKIFHKWKMQTAVGGGPVLLQNGDIKITNNEELKFGGKAINDKHPRTAMGYTKDGRLVILVIQGRSESGGGASLPQEAQLLKDLGCWEALNLDGGGSSCMLVNGKETIRPSDKEGQRPVPAVFEIFRR